MSKVMLYIATTIDGYIARENGALDWLNEIPNPENLDYGYGELMESVDTIIMGRKTYEEVLGFGVEWPYAGKKTLVVTRKTGYKMSTPDTAALSGDIRDTVNRRKQQAGKDIWLVGGGELNTIFLNHRLIDRMILTVVPVILGGGILLFADRPAESRWELSNTQNFSTGLVCLTYEFTSDKVV